MRPSWEVAAWLLVPCLGACGDDRAGPVTMSGAGLSGGAGQAGSSAGKAGHSGSSSSSGGADAGSGSADAGSGSDAGRGGGNSGAGGPARAECDEPASPAPARTWVNATGNLANMPSECGNLGLVSAQPCSKRVIAGVAKQGLWQTTDGGETWTALGTGAGSAVITNRISSLVYDPLDPNVFWESGIYNGGGVYKTSDGGTTFEQLGDIAHCDSVSVDLSDPERKTLVAGTHENNTPLHYSKDGGATWSNIAAGLPSGQCTATLVLDASTFLVACNSGPIVRTTNAGGDWADAAGSTGGGRFQPLLAADGTIYWPGYAGGVWISGDGGQSFTAGATSAEAPGLIGPSQPAELPDGRVVILGTDHLLASADGGRSWSEIGEELPFPGGGHNGARGVAYSAQSKTFYIWRWTCEDTVAADAVMSMGFDWETD